MVIGFRSNATRRFGRLAVSCGAMLLAMGVYASKAYSHPMHTTLTEVTIAPDGGIQIVLRAFIDDFSAAVTRRPALANAKTPTPPDSAIARYLTEMVRLEDAASRRVGLEVASLRRTDDLVWITLRAPALRSIAGAHLANRVLFDRWDDQVNIVQTTIGNRRQTLLFTKREGGTAKAI